MAFSRYGRTPILNYGSSYGTNRAREAIQSAMANGQLNVTNTLVTRGYERLDTIAGEVYGDGRYWWVLAAASQIGWGLQVPPGTVIYIPDISVVASLVG
jgi:nucleoid-associated protein YgaU